MLDIASTLCVAHLFVRKPNVCCFLVTFWVSRVDWGLVGFCRFSMVRVRIRARVRCTCIVVDSRLGIGFSEVDCTSWLYVGRLRSVSGNCQARIIIGCQHICNKMQVSMSYRRLTATHCL